MANELEQLARELLAAEYRADGLQPIADDVLTRPFELLNSDEKLALRAIVAALQQAQQPLPKLNISCETVGEGVTGTTSLPVIRVEAQDDGSFTAVTNYWPPPPLPEGVSELVDVACQIRLAHQSSMDSTILSCELFRKLGDALESYRACLAAKGGV